MKHRHNFGISHEYNYDGKEKGIFRIVVVDTSKARYWYKGALYKWMDMGSFLRKKFDNALYILRSNDNIKIVYT